MRPIILQPDYTQNRGGYQLAIPANVEILIPSDDSVRLLSQVLEVLDYRQLEKAASYQKRKGPSRKQLLKIVVYGYMNGLYSSRDINQACRRDINFMFLLEGKKAPSKSTIAQFRSETPPGVVEDLFAQLSERLLEWGEISGKILYVDGTKFEANANRYSFVWRKAVEKNQDKLMEKLPGILKKIQGENGLEAIVLGCSGISEVKATLSALEAIKEKQGVIFVHGTGKKKTGLQRGVETLREILGRMEKYAAYAEIFQGRNSFSKTDHDATFMRLKDDHMRNGQLKPAYNVQIGVDAEYIVGVDISSERSDVDAMLPLLKKVGQLSFAYETVVADAGYESEENYSYLSSRKINANIKPINYEQSKGRSYKKDISRAENMAYNVALDYYLCSQGQQIVPMYERKQKSKSGYVSSVTVYECESCDGCPVKEKCIRSKAKIDLELRHKRFNISKDFQRFRSESLQKINSPAGIELRVNRSIQVEGVFGAIKEDMSFRRFMLRGKEKVRSEFLFLAMGHNMLKLHSKIQHRRTGHYLHKIGAA